MRKFVNYEFSANEDSARSLGPYTLFVSLYLVILAFFILLNSISERDLVKTKGAVSSVRTSFSAKDTPSYPYFITPNFLEHSFVINEQREVLFQMISEVFQVVFADVQIVGNKLVINVGKDEFFTDKDMQINLHSQKVLRNLANIIKQNEHRLEVKVHFVVASAGLLVSNLNSAYNDDLLRVKRIVTHLMNKGLSPYLISGGVFASDEDSINFSITVEQADEHEEGVNEGQ